MVTDPYKVLGVSRDATPEEIKKAYRKKAKEYHPDLHPDEPDIAKKMSEVNEAYDMIMNPQKYSRQSSRAGGQYQQGRTYQGGYGQYGPFTDFNFEDIFSSFYGAMPSTPHIMTGDSPEIIKIISEINMRHYQNAINLLNRIESTKRNARWHYLCSLANYGIGNTVAALSFIQTAVRMDSNNAEYQKVLNFMSRSGQAYTQTGKSYGINLSSLESLCWTLCAFKLCCPFC